MNYKNLNETLEDIIGSALNDNVATIGVDRNGEPAGPECVLEDDFDIVIKQAIKDIKKSNYINIRFKGEK